MRKSSAFTLIELLIVVAIIGILAAIAVPNFLNAQTRARVARAESDQKSIGTALEMYRMDQNGYPLGGASWAVFGLDQLTTPIAYLSSIPKDPFEFKVQSTAGGFGFFPETVPNYVYFYAKGGSPDLSRDYFLYTGQIKNHNAGVQTVDKWQLRSIGPNGQGDFAYPYNGSNGLVSVGDICRFGP